MSTIDIVQHAYNKIFLGTIFETSSFWGNIVFAPSHIPTLDLGTYNPGYHARAISLLAANFLDNEDSDNKKPQEDKILRWFSFFMYSVWNRHRYQLSVTKAPVTRDRIHIGSDPHWIRCTFRRGVYTGSDPEPFAFTRDRIHLDL